MKQYSGLTRVWTDVPVSVTDTELLKITRGRGYIACSLYPGAVMAYIHEEDWEYRLESGDLVFTEVDGVGFDPIQVLCDGLDAYPDSSKKEFISMAIDEHSYEEEIVIVSPTRITRTEQPEWEDDGIW
jgi:hypothetical protein